MSTSASDMQNKLSAAMDELESTRPDFSPRYWGIAVVLCMILVGGLWLVARFSAEDRDQDIRNWHDRLNLVAESRAADIGKWVQGNYKELHALAANPSLQLYVSELEAGGGAASPEAMPQHGYLRNLLLFVAGRGGFSGATAGDVTQIPANLPSSNKSGLIILNKDNAVVVSTPMSHNTQEELSKQSAQLPRGKENLLDLQKDQDGTVYIGFTVPVYSLQGEQDSKSQIGTVIGIRTVDKSFFDLLKHPGATDKTLESVLMRSNEFSIDYLSPLMGSTVPMARQEQGEQAKNSPISRMLKNPNDHVVESRDYRGVDVLMTARRVAATPWTLLVKIDREEAFAQSGARRATMVTIFLLIILVMLLTVAAIWWHANSRRAMMMSWQFRKMATSSLAQERLLRLVADHQPEALYIVDDKQLCRFANQQAANDLHMALEAVPDKTIVDLRGNARAGYIRKQCEQAAKEGRIQYDMQRVSEHEQEKIFRAAYVPLEHIPLPNLEERVAGTLIIEQNITEIVHEREERLRAQAQLVKTLVHLVDKRDPFAASHSLMVSDLAATIAVHMGLAEQMVETIRIAGNVMNIGKIVVPTELLTKTSGLTDEEKRIVADSMNIAAELLSDIRFEGPVVETLRQWQEHYDGSGPKKLKGENILISARVISVANAFVGMVSPRSWRDAMKVEAITKYLLENCETHFDRRVVVALVYYIENHEGRAWLAQVRDDKRKRV